MTEVFHNFAVCFTDLITSNRARGVQGLLATTEGLPHLAAAERLAGELPQPGKADIGYGPENYLVFQILLREAKEVVGGVR